MAMPEHSMSPMCQLTGIVRGRNAEIATDKGKISDVVIMGRD